MDPQNSQSTESERDQALHPVPGRVDGPAEQHCQAEAHAQRGDTPAGPNRTAPQVDDQQGTECGRQSLPGKQDPVEYVIREADK